MIYIKFERFLLRESISDFLLPGEAVLYRSPPPRLRLDKRPYLAIATIGLLFFVVFSLLEGQWPVEMFIIFGGIAAVKLYQDLSYDFAITDQRILWLDNRWFGALEAVFLSDIRELEVVWRLFFPALEVRGDLGPLLSTRSFSDLPQAIKKLRDVTQPHRAFLPSQKLLNDVEAMVIGVILVILTAILTTGAVLIGALSQSEGVFETLGYVVLILIALPASGIIGAILGFLITALRLKGRFKEKPMEILLYLGDDPAENDNRLEVGVTKACAFFLTLILRRRIRYDPSNYNKLRYS